MIKLTFCRKLWVYSIDMTLLGWFWWYLWPKMIYKCPGKLQLPLWILPSLDHWIFFLSALCICFSKKLSPLVITGHSIWTDVGSICRSRFVRSNYLCWLILFNVVRSRDCILKGQIFRIEIQRYIILCVCNGTGVYLEVAAVKLK